MRANCWIGTEDVRVETVPDPKILNRQDVIVKITSSAICGSDLRLPLEQAPHGYAIFKEKQDDCIKIVLKPH